MMLFWIGLGHTRTLALVIGAAHLWQEDCEIPNPTCVLPARDLRYVDEDAWRWTWLLRHKLGPESVLTFISPNDLDGQPYVHYDVGGYGFPGEAAPGDAAPTTFNDVITGAPTYTAIITRVTEWAQQHPDTLKDPIEVQIYFSGHGSAFGRFRVYQQDVSEGLHLDDGVYPFDMLTSALEEVTQGAVTLVVADTCDGAALTRGSPEDDAALVVPSTGGYVSISVNTEAVEVNELQIGYMTLMTTTSLLGAADTHTQGTIQAGEVASFLSGYAGSIQSWFSPMVQAPQRNARYHVPDLFGRGTLAFDAPTDGPTTHWSIHVTPGVATPGVATPGVDQPSLLVADFFMSRGEDIRFLHLPPGFYQVYRTPYLENGHQGPVGQVWDVEVREAEDVAIWDATAARSFTIQQTRGEADSTISVNVDPGFLQFLQEARPSRPYHQAWGYYAGDQSWLYLYPTVATPILGRAEPLTGAMLGAYLPYPSAGGHLRFDVGGWALGELGAIEPSALRLFGGGLGLDVALYAQPRWRFGLVAQVAGEGLMLTAVRGDVTERWLSFSPGLNIGPRLVLPFTNASLDLGLMWSPRLIREEDDVRQTSAWTEDIQSVRLSIGGGWRR